MKIIFRGNKKNLDIKFRLLILKNNLPTDK